MNSVPNLQQAAKNLGLFLQQSSTSIVTAESCTGGWIAQSITDIAGSSAWFDRGFITYSNSAKTDMLAVPAEIIAQFGAVSAEVAGLMTAGALQHSTADYAIATTGIAGPTGGTAQKPVGTVYLAWQQRGQPAVVILKKFKGNRAQVRMQAVYTALTLIPTSILG
ncbi:MAG: nicotinamide-nucleotide amidase [Methyloprofundus sp.]|nr:MAG: nicotinamide-nucleotide amidase [Methyloprofundus sp.]